MAGVGEQIDREKLFASFPCEFSMREDAEIQAIVRYGRRIGTVRIDPCPREENGICRECDLHRSRPDKL